MLLDAAMSILSRLSKVAGSVIVDIIFRWTSSPQAEEAGHSVADCVPSAVDLVLGIFAGNAFGVAALVSSKRISVDQCLFKSSAGCLNDLDRPSKEVPQNCQNSVRVSEGRLKNGLIWDKIPNMSGLTFLPKISCKIT